MSAILTTDHFYWNKLSRVLYQDKSALKDWSKSFHKNDIESFNLVSTYTGEIVRFNCIQKIANSKDKIIAWEYEPTPKNANCTLVVYNV